MYIELYKTPNKALSCLVFTGGGGRGGGGVNFYKLELEWACVSDTF